MTTRDTDSYKAEFYRRLPRGPIWPLVSEDATVWDSLLDCMALEFSRARERADSWLSDFFPDATTDQLADWERVLGLPDCNLALGTDAERRASIVAKLRRRGNPTLANIQTLADTFGVNAVVSASGTSALFFVGVDEVNNVNVVAGDYAASTVTVTYDAPTNLYLECAIRHAVPLHLTLVFVEV